MPALLLLALLVAAPVSAAPGACYAIAAPDARAYCLARAHADPGRCYAIQAADLRAQCRAEVGS